MEGGWGRECGACPSSGSVLVQALRTGGDGTGWRLQGCPKHRYHCCQLMRIDHARIRGGCMSMCVPHHRGGREHGEEGGWAMYGKGV